MTSCVLPALDLPPIPYTNQLKIDNFIVKLFGLAGFNKYIKENGSKSKKMLRTILKKTSQKPVGKKTVGKKTVGKKTVGKKTVSFSKKETYYIIPRRTEEISKDTTLGFGSLGTVGEMEAYESQASIWGAPAQPKSSLPPLSKSRIVRRRWLSLEIKSSRRSLLNY